jgi:hypothetical protein
MIYWIPFSEDSASANRRLIRLFQQKAISIRAARG